jgi:hypothetical protein
MIARRYKSPRQLLAAYHASRDEPVPALSYPHFGGARP